MMNTDGDKVSREEGVYTMDEVIQDEENLIVDANAMLGEADPENCSYDLGYIRQALYSCLTCNPADSETCAGICIACSLSCHDGHELVELYTKRHFQCDCGNSKFASSTSSKCSLAPNKKATNTENLYNHNFNGLYCNCNRPYPDPERETEEEMIQCCICEDWFHEEHLNIKNDVEDEEFADLVCNSCVQKHLFLRIYSATTTTSSDTTTTSTSTDCKLEKAYSKTSDNDDEVTSLFLKEGWRKELCQCTKCCTMYITEKLEFLNDSTDSIAQYEARGAAAGNGSIEAAGAKALTETLSHSQQVEMAIGYNKLSTEFRGYLKDFKNKVVEKKDIETFFESLKEERDAKRQKK